MYGFIWYSHINPLVIYYSIPSVRQMSDAPSLISPRHLNHLAMELIIRDDKHAESESPHVRATRL